MNLKFYNLKWSIFKILFLSTIYFGCSLQNWRSFLWCEQHFLELHWFGSSLYWTALTWIRILLYNAVAYFFIHCFKWLKLQFCEDMVAERIEQGMPGMEGRRFYPQSVTIFLKNLCRFVGKIMQLCGKNHVSLWDNCLQFVGKIWWTKYSVG